MGKKNATMSGKEYIPYFKVGFMPMNVQCLPTCLCMG